MHKYYILSIVFCLLSCAGKEASQNNGEVATADQGLNKTSLLVLGTIQDAGSPQIGCTKDCCSGLFENPDADRKVTSLGLWDAENQKMYLFEATPDIGAQIKILHDFGTKKNSESVDGIFLTHAHIGHYTGLMYLGKEAMDASNIPVYAMPRMKDFLSRNGPWGQLVSKQNIALQELANEQPIRLSESIEVTPFLVPHRDEYSETVGYRIRGPNKSVLFIPDIDKWEKWDNSITDEIKKADYALLDATFYSGAEINSRDIKEIPHPSIIESVEQFNLLEAQERGKIIFIHFNHTNPVLIPESMEARKLTEQGFQIAKIREVLEL